jgi:choline dehydrogenase-like flavoprotein
MLDDIPLYDCVIVGTGIAGATTGYELVKAGKKILFIEEGRERDNLSINFSDQIDESQVNDDTFLKAGRWVSMIKHSKKGKGKTRLSIPFLGRGEGGSSALFGMVMERMHSQDFEWRDV